jgi:hypothetical protein
VIDISFGKQEIRSGVGPLVAAIPFFRFVLISIIIHHHVVYSLTIGVEGQALLAQHRRRERLTTLIQTNNQIGAVQNGLLYHEAS